MYNGRFRVLSDAASGSLAVFTAISGVAIFVLIRWYRNKTRGHEMDLPPEQQSVEVEVTCKFFFLTSFTLLFEQIYKRSVCQNHRTPLNS